MAEKKSTFQITNWDEKTVQEIDAAAKLTCVSVTQSYSGAIAGNSCVEYLMAYSIHGTANFVGFERVSGTVDGRTGTFVIQHVGSFVDGKARSDWSVVPGVGTDELAGLCGRGTYAASHGELGQVSFTYSFDENSN